MELDSKEDSTIANERNVRTIAMWTPFPQPLRTTGRHADDWEESRIYFAKRHILLQYFRILLLFLFTVVYIYNLYLLGQINSQQDNRITFDVAYKLFIDNEVVDGDIYVLASPCHRAFLRLFKLGLTSDFRGNKMFSADSKLQVY